MYAPAPAGAVSADPVSAGAVSAGAVSAAAAASFDSGESADIDPQPAVVTARAKAVKKSNADLDTGAPSLPAAVWPAKRLVRGVVFGPRVPQH